MTLADAYADDLHNLVDELDERDVFAPGEIEAWREGIDEADTVTDYMLVNDSIVEVLDDREGLDDALDATLHHETNAFY